jgi:hypothetical protein
MLFLVGIGLALAIALLTARCDTDVAFFVPRFVIACLGVLLVGLLLFAASS